MNRKPKNRSLSRVDRNKRQRNTEILLTKAGLGSFASSGIAVWALGPSPTFWTWARIAAPGKSGAAHLLEKGCIPVFAEDFPAIRHVLLYNLYSFPTLWQAYTYKLYIWPASIIVENKYRLKCHRNALLQTAPTATVTYLLWTRAVQMFPCFGCDRLVSTQQPVKTHISLDSKDKNQ